MQNPQTFRTAFLLAAAGVVAVDALIALRAQSPDPKSPEFQAQERTPTKVEQTRPATNFAGSSLLRSIGAAEDEAARYPRGPETGAVNDLESMTPYGSSARHCVDVGTNHEVRSGEFVAGPFDLFPDMRLKALEWGRNGGKLWFIPRHIPPRYPPPADSASLLVRATRLDRSADSRERSWSIWSRSLGSKPPVLFFATNPPLTSSGRWMVVATAGPNWGCFVLELP
jgi:hypothetical protein